MPKVPRQRNMTRTRTASTDSKHPKHRNRDHRGHQQPRILAQPRYELFLASGAPHGRDLEHWLQAERELRNRSVSAGN